MNNKMRQWSLFTALGAVGILVLSWFMLISPQRSHAAALHTQASQVQTQNAQLQDQVAQLQSEKRDLPTLQRKLAQVDSEIPTTPALPELIRDLSSAANDAGVNLVSIAPSRPAPYTAPVIPATTGDTAAAPAAPAAPATGVPATGAATLNQIGVAVTVQGSYYNLVSFFQAVEQMKRTLRVNGFSISPNGGSGGSSSQPTSAVQAGTAGSGADALPPGTLTGSLQAVVFEQAQTVVQPLTVPPTAAPAQ